MTDSDFIELLNLYLDHEIGVEDAARLEAEVHASPERLKLYRQYCRMQKACSMLAAAPAEADGKVISFEKESRRIGAGTFAAAGLFAAAAAAAVVFWGRMPASRAPASSPLAASAPAVASVSLPGDQRDVPLQPVLSARAFTTSASGAGPLWSGADIAWMSRVDMPPVPPAPAAQVSSGAKMAPSPELTALTVRPSDSGSGADLEAFEFQK